MATLDVVEKIIIPLIAAFVGAFLAFFYQSKYEQRKAKRDILTILMAYRGKYVKEPDFRHAVNMIDVVFYNNHPIRIKRIEYLRNLEEDRIDSLEYVDNLIDLILLISEAAGYNNLTREHVLSYYHLIPRSTPPPSENEGNEV